MPGRAKIDPKVPVYCMKKELIELKVNGRVREIAIESSKLLLDTLRQDLQLTGSKRGCDDSSSAHAPS